MNLEVSKSSKKPGTFHLQHDLKHYTLHSRFHLRIPTSPQIAGGQLPQDLISSPSALPLFNEVDRYLDANDDDCNWQDLELEEEIEQSKKKRALAAARLEKAKAEIQMAASDKPRSVIYSFVFPGYQICAFGSWFQIWDSFFFHSSGPSLLFVPATLKLPSQPCEDKSRFLSPLAAA